MIIPYRVKNPVNHFPIATVTIIAVNIIIYLFTAEYLLWIREDVVLRYGFALGKLPFLNVISAAFLHGDITHLLGNMLFLWIFGPSVEDRLRIPKYLGLYFVTGIIGFVLQAVLDIAFSGSVRPIIGASACIMGVAGAYWYLFPWSTVCVLYWFYFIWYGVWEIAAHWVIGFYILMDLAQGLLIDSVYGGGGVANFAHVGGGFAGILLCLVMRAKRDTEAMSEAKAIHADAKDLNGMPMHALETMLEEETGNLDVIRALIDPAMRLGKQEVIDQAFAGAGAALLDKDPGLAAFYLIDLRGNPEIYKPIHLLRLASIKERSGDHGSAVALYKLLADTWPKAPESETALYRMALCLWNNLKDAAGARSCLSEMQRRFPAGDMLQFGKALWQRIG